MRRLVWGLMLVMDARLVIGLELIIVMDARLGDWFGGDNCDGCGGSD